MLFRSDISHWLDAVRLREVCFSLHCRDYQANIVESTPYRKFFDLNNLPDIYTGMYYIRYSQTAANLFRTAQTIYTNWSLVQESLIQCPDLPSTDIVFAIAARIVGEEQCVIPSLDFFNFAHMKSGVQKWSDSQPWTDYVNVEQDGSMLRINNVNQYNPVHYHEKSFLS